MTDRIPAIAAILTWPSSGARPSGILVLTAPGERERTVVADLITRIRDQPSEVLAAIARSMDVRAAEPAMQSICARYMAAIAVQDSCVLEVGCGNGAATKLIMQHLRPARLIGID